MSSEQLKVQYSKGGFIMKKSIFLLSIMSLVAVLVSGCATKAVAKNRIVGAPTATEVRQADDYISYTGDLDKDEEKKVVSEPGNVPAGMVAFDTVEGFKSHVFKALLFVEYYEEQRVCCLDDNPHIREVLLEEVIRNLEYLENYKDIVMKFRSWDKRILPYMRMLPGYEKELVSVREVLRQPEKIEGSNGLNVRPAKKTK